jgi:TIR domain
MRLRLVVHAGDMIPDPHGQAGASIIHAARLLDAEGTRLVLENARAATAVLVVSEVVYEGIVRHGYEGIDPTAWQPIPIHAKETTARAWLHLPGLPIQPPLPEQLASSASTAGTDPGQAARSADSGMLFDAYISHVDEEPDATWVRDVLVPRQHRAGLNVALSGYAEPPGGARLVGIERGIVQARRTIVVLSPRYLVDGYAAFENVLAQTIGVEESRDRLIPVRIADLHNVPLPARLRMLTSLDMTRPPLTELEFARLLRALRP